jgi:hypothetical protein
VGKQFKRPKNHAEHGGDIDIAWGDGYCTVGGTSYMRTHFLFPDSDAPEGEHTGFGFHPEFTAEELDDLIATLQQARREAFGGKPPMAVTMEIVERGRKTDDTMAGSLILPSDVRINGVSVVTCDGIRIHEMTVRPPKEMAMVTVTLPVRLLTIGAEGDLSGGQTPDDHHD